jgi:hypothetical protein
VVAPNGHQEVMAGIDLSHNVRGQNGGNIP